MDHSGVTTMDENVSTDTCCHQMMLKRQG